MATRAQGANAILAGGFEGTYGIAATTLTSLHFSSFSGGNEIALEASDLLGDGRDPAAPTDGPIKNEPSIDVPVDPREFGIWLTALLGDPVTTGTGPYTHTWKSGGATLPSLTLDLGLTDLGKYYRQKGFSANTMAIDWATSGKVKATITGVAQTEAEANSALDDTPVELVMQRFSVRQGFVKIGADYVGNLVGGKFNYSNNLDVVRTIRDDGLIDGADPGKVDLGGELRVRMSADALATAEAARSEISDLTFGYKISNSLSLAITCHEVYLPKDKKGVTGPGGIEKNYAFKGAKNAAAGCAMTVVLINDVASYD